MGALAKWKQVFKLGKGAPQFKGKSQSYTKRWESVVKRKKTFLIYFVMTDESNVI